MGSSIPNFRWVLRTLVTAVTVLSIAGCRESVDLIVYNANIYTVDSSAPRANSFAVHGGRFVAVGDSADVFAARRAGTLRNARGMTIVPGLIDAHGHLLNEGVLRLSVDLVGTGSMDEVVGRLLAGSASLPEGDWLYGRGWDQNDWPVKRFPVRQDLDRAFPSRPVWIERIDGHAILVNSAALRLIGIDTVRGMADPAGGHIVRDDRGDPTGLFIDRAEEIVTSAVPAPSSAWLAEAIRRGNREALRFGLTTVHEPGLRGDTLRIYEELADNGELDVRVYAMIEEVGAELTRRCAGDSQVGRAHASDRLIVRAVKIYADGALGSRGAALIEPYEDDPTNRGLLLQPEDEIAVNIRRVVDCGFQPAVHAIGDRAVRIVLDAYQQLDGPRLRSVRPRIEHAQVVHRDDIGRFAKLGIIAVMQPTHATSDMYWAGDRIGVERVQTSYAWRSILDSGARVAFGSDFPVESVDPVKGFHAAVTRQDADGWPSDGWLPEQRVSREEALRGFTLDAAYAAFLEDDVGAIRSGMRADFVVLDRDIMVVPTREILETAVVATYIDGREVYTATDDTL